MLYCTAGDLGLGRSDRLSRGRGPADGGGTVPLGQGARLQRQRKHRRLLPRSVVSFKNIFTPGEKYVKNLGSLDGVVVGPTDQCGWLWGQHGKILECNRDDEVTQI